MPSNRSNIDFTHVSRAPGMNRPLRIFPVFSRMGIIEGRSHYAYKEHQHQQYEVIVVSRGTYRCRLNKVWLTLKADDILIVKPGDWHADVCEKALRYYGLGFYFDPGWHETEIPALFDQSVRPQQQHVKLPRRFINRILDGIQAESERSDPQAPHLQDALLLEFFWRIVRAFPSEVISERFLNLSVDVGFPNQLMRLFRQHLQQSLSVDEMAKLMHVSKRTLTQRCQRLLNISPAKAFTKFKMEQAKYFMEYSTMSVKEAALYLGFADPYHFSKCFKKYFGVSPSQAALIVES